MRLAALLSLLAAPAPAPALAEADVSALVAAQGLRGAEAALVALPSPTPSERFALGGVRVLRGVERALQARWRVGLSGGMAEMSGLPVLRLPVPPNPAPEPFEPAVIEALFAGIEEDMAAALDALAPIRDEDEVAVVVDTGDLWFDVDMDGRRGPGEGLGEVAGAALFGGMADPGPVTVRFDTADAAWLAAYAHLLSGVSDGVQAVAPAQAVERVLASREAFAALGLPAPDPYGFGLADGYGDVVDLLATVVLALRAEPDAARVAAMRDHLLACIEQNRRFWRLVAREGDDEAEWIPNKRQASATGLPFPPGTGRLWLDVLDDAEAVLRGERLIPFWRVGPGVGIDLAAILADPPPLDPVGLIQGEALVPYLKAGPLADGEALMRFTAMMQGDSLLFAAMLN